VRADAPERACRPTWPRCFLDLCKLCLQSQACRPHMKLPSCQQSTPYCPCAQHPQNKRMHTSTREQCGGGKRRTGAGRAPGLHTGTCLAAAAARLAGQTAPARAGAPGPPPQLHPACCPHTVHGRCPAKALPLSSQLPGRGRPAAAAAPPRGDGRGSAEAAPARLTPRHTSS